MKDFLCAFWFWLVIAVCAFGVLAFIHQMIALWQSTPAERREIF